MKKLIYLSLVGFMLAASPMAIAQVQFAVGLKGGLNFANLDLHKSPSVNYEGRTGYHAGAYALFKFSKIGIQPEVIFSRQGQDIKVNTSSYSSNYDYINIPIIVKFYIVGGLNLQAGPQFGFLSSAKGPVADGQGVVTSDQDLKAYVKSSDVSLGLGFGWDLPFGLNIGARYNLGLTDINKQSGSSSVTNTAMSDSQTKNQVFQISAGYRLFKIGS